MNLSLRFDFANLLFSGACSARCPFCIGRRLDRKRIPPNLDEYPPRNLEAFIAHIHRFHIRRLALTGANTDPQLYAHEARLIERLRGDIPGAQISLHTNGRQALSKMEVFNTYDRATISFPSFDPETYRRVMGVADPPDLAEIIRRACIPVKLSWVLTAHNLPELGEFLRRCRDLGVRRVALRKLYGDRRSWEALIPFTGLGLHRRGAYHGSPIYNYDEVEVTLWDFAASECRSINLFSSGEITVEYLITDGNQPTAMHTQSILMVAPTTVYGVSAQRKPKCP